MILSDTAIRQKLAAGVVVIKPEPQDWQIQPASVDVMLGSEFMSPYDNKRLRYDRTYVIMPGECILATTAEYFEIPDTLVARIEGKSSWGRKFLTAHVTAGYIDPGFRGQITLELVNHSRVSQQLDIGAPIAQVSFEPTDQPVARPYGHPDLRSHYQDQHGVTASALEWR